MARPRIEISQDLFEDLCKIQCTAKEISSVLHCSEDTILRWCKRTYKKTFKEIMEGYKDYGKSCVRRAQWQMAQTNPQMSIWWGKQFLGQTDRKEIDHTGSVPVVIHDDLPDD